MSKYTEARKCVERWTFINGNGFTNQDIKDIVCKALQIADRLEQVDVINNEEIYIKACRRYGCWESECPHRARDRFCSDLAEIFFDGYAQALSDMRGDTE